MNCLCNLFDDCDVWLWIAIIILVYHVLCCDNGCGGGNNGGCGGGCGNNGGCGCDCIC